jgi:nitroimidazol reductase NimA-like FMN-containing flavoprotein (pyridoxamine 5'-phosphate oxidase superfamily)
MPTPVIRELTVAQCEALLARHQVARLAYTMHDRVDIEPIHYVWADGAVWGRTSAGTKLDILLRRPWVALEVDEVDGPYQWQSVVVKGTLYFLHAEGSEQEQATFAQGRDILRRLDPAFFTDADPMPHRTALFRLHVDGMTGRACAPA